MGLAPEKVAPVASIAPVAVSAPDVVIAMLLAGANVPRLAVIALL